jgi:hypothetical protein
MRGDDLVSALAERDERIQALEAWLQRLTENWVAGSCLTTERDAFNRPRDRLRTSSARPRVACMCAPPGRYVDSFQIEKPLIVQ